MDCSDADFDLMADDDDDVLKVTDNADNNLDKSEATRGKKFFIICSFL